MAPHSSCPQFFGLDRFQELEDGLLRSVRRADAEIDVVLQRHDHQVRDRILRLHRQFRRLILLRAMPHPRQVPAPMQTEPLPPPELLSILACALHASLFC